MTTLEVLIAARTVAEVNDYSGHAAVLAMYDRAIENCAENAKLREANRG